MGGWLGGPSQPYLIAACLFRKSPVHQGDNRSPDPVEGESMTSGFCSLPVPTKGWSQLVTGKPQDNCAQLKEMSTGHCGSFFKGTSAQ